MTLRRLTDLPSGRHELLLFSLKKSLERESASPTIKSKARFPRSVKTFTAALLRKSKTSFCFPKRQTTNILKLQSVAKPTLHQCNLLRQLRGHRPSSSLCKIRLRGKVSAQNCYRAGENQGSRSTAAKSSLIRAPAN